MTESFVRPMRKRTFFLPFNERVEHFDARRQHRNEIYDNRAAITRLTFAQLKLFYDTSVYRYQTASIVNVLIACYIKNNISSCRDIKEKRRMDS